MRQKISPSKREIKKHDYRKLFEEQLPVILAAKKGKVEALEELERLSRKLREAKAYKFLPGRPDLHEDAIQAGWEGVLKALNKWNPKWERVFLAYAHWDIAEAIRLYKYRMESTVCRPMHMHRKLSKLAKYGTSDAEELSGLSGMSLKSVNKILAIKYGDVSLHKHEEEDAEFENRFLYHCEREVENQPFRSLVKEDLMRILERSLKRLNERESHIIRLYYYSDATFGQIAETMNLTRQRVEQIHAEGMKKLQKLFLEKDPELGIKIGRKKRVHHRWKRRVQAEKAVC